MIKQTLKNIILIAIIILLIFNFDNIKIFILNLVDDISYKTQTNEIILPKTNEYKLNYNYNYVKSTDNFKPKNEEDIKNIIFTILNNGWEKFVFICPKEYESCLNDSIEITNNNLLLSDINSFVHPYNSFKKISTTYTSNGKFTIEIEKNYDDEMIKQINDKINKIYPTLINDTMSTESKIKSIHDYIINNSIYDENYTRGIKYFSSNTAYGSLIQGEAICSGYTDAMAIFLNRLNIPNYRISSERHVWNLVDINGNWKHIDLTFDDPVTNTGEQILSHDYFLINTKKLHFLDIAEHSFDSNVFSEVN